MVTGLMDGPDLETTQRDRGCGQVTHQVRLDDVRGKGHEIEVTVYGWKVRLLIEAATKIPLPVKVGKMHKHKIHWPRALVAQARTIWSALPACTPRSLFRAWAAGEGLSHGRRVHTVRHGQGRATHIERLETEIVGITRLTTSAQYGTPEHG